MLKIYLHQKFVACIVPRLLTESQIIVSFIVLSRVAPLAPGVDTVLVFTYPHEMHSPVKAMQKPGHRAKCLNLGILLFTYIVLIIEFVMTNLALN